MLICKLGRRGWRSGESTRLPQMWPEFDSRIRRHMRAAFVVGSSPCSNGLPLGYPVFLPPQNKRFQIPIQSAIRGP